MPQPHSMFPRGLMLLALAASPGAISAATAAEFRFPAAGFSPRVGVEANSQLHWAETSAGGAPIFPRSGLGVTWRSEAGTVFATLRNDTAAPIKLGRFILAPVEAVPGEAALVMTGWQPPNTVQATARARAGRRRRTVDPVCADVNSPRRKRALGFRPRAVPDIFPPAPALRWPPPRVACRRDT